MALSVPGDFYGSLQFLPLATKVEEADAVQLQRIHK